MSKLNWQKQPSRAVLIKRCSENMQQIYRRTPMTKCYFKDAKQIQHEVGAAIYVIATS